MTEGLVSKVLLVQDKLGELRTGQEFLYSLLPSLKPDRACFRDKIILSWQQETVLHITKGPSKLQWMVRASREAPVSLCQGRDL